MVRRTEVLQGLRMMKFVSLLDRVEAAELSKLEAAEILGISERTFRRWCGRYREEGETGLADRRLGKPSAKRVPDAAAEEIERLYRERYLGFSAKHFHEHLVADHGFRWGYTWTKTFLHGRGLLRAAPRRGAHRRRRPRKPLPGMMLHQDASRHVWVPGQPALDLVVTLDDATGEIYSAILVAEEGTVSTFRALLAVFARHGLPCSLYTDRGSHYFITPKAGEKPDPKARTQVGRALAQLGVEHIAAFSPQARGRSERAFRTLQDRLPKELALDGIDGIEAANRFLAEGFLERWNARFAVPAEQPGTAFVPVDEAQLRQILCIEEPRRVGNDNTVTFHRYRLQIPPGPLRPHYVKAQVKVRQYLDGTFAVFHGPREIGRYDAAGALQTQTPEAGVNRFDAEPNRGPVRGLDGQPSRVAHNPTGPTATAEAVNPCAT
jgi:transposase